MGDLKKSIEIFDSEYTYSVSDYTREACFIVGEVYPQREPEILKIRPCRDA